MQPTNRTKIKQSKICENRNKEKRKKALQNFVITLMNIYNNTTYPAVQSIQKAIMWATEDQLGGAVRQRRALDHVTCLHPPLHLSCPSVQYIDVVIIATWNVQDVKWLFFMELQHPKLMQYVKSSNTSKRQHLMLSPWHGANPDAVSITRRKSQTCQGHFLKKRGLVSRTKLNEWAAGDCCFNPLHGTN